MSAKHPLEYIAKCRRFASARVGARLLTIADTLDEAMRCGARWRPTIGGELFVPANGQGYETRADAIADAKQIKQQCAAVVAEGDAP